MTQSIEQLAAALDDAARTLTLGQALSPAQPATLSIRGESGFLLGEIRGAASEGEPPIAAADADGHLANSVSHARLRAAATLHAAVLKARPGASAVALVRAPRLAVWGLARRALPVRYFQMFGYTRAPEIPVAHADPAAIGAALAAGPDTPALLLDDGRALIWAPQAGRAVRLVLSLEEAAQVTALADRIGGARDYPAEARDKIYQSLRAQQRR